MEKYTLRTARDRAGLTLAKAAAEMGINVDTLANYEKGETYPNVPVLRKMLALYGVEFNQLIFLGIDYDLIVNRKEDA